MTPRSPAPTLPYTFAMARHETPYGPWDPLTPSQVFDLLRGVIAPWWISGGYAIEAFVGCSFRDHDDIDVGIFRRDQLEVREHLAGWDLHAADPPGTLRPWPVAELLPALVHDVWCRPSPDAPWSLQFMLNDQAGSQWVFRPRRDNLATTGWPDVRLPGSALPRARCPAPFQVAGATREG